MDNFAYVGEKIKSIMKKKGYTYQKLAEEAKLAEKTIKLAVSAPASRTLDTLARIAKTLGISLAWLLEPAPPWEEEPQAPKKKIYLRVSEPTLDILTARANDLGISRSAYIDGILAQAARMYRVQCGECEGIFWVEQERGWQCCPYCGAREEEMIDEPIVQ